MTATMKRTACGRDFVLSARMGVTALLLCGLYFAALVLPLWLFHEGILPAKFAFGFDAVVLLLFVLQYRSLDGMASLSVLLCWRFCAHIRLRSSPLLGAAHQCTWLRASRLWISPCRMLTGGIYASLQATITDGLTSICGKGIEQHVAFSKGSV